MTHLSITLGIARQEGNPRSLKASTGASSVVRGVLTPEIKKAVFERDSMTCRCCGFRSERYQEVLFLDSNSKNVAMSNLATTCIFCHQCFDLELASRMRSGVLIWMPEISQADLNHLMRAVYVARISQGPMAEAARVVLDAVMGRREAAQQRIQTNDPFVLATVLRDFLTGRYYADRNPRLDGIRLLPLDRRLIREADLEFNQFPQILAYWRSKDGPFGEKSPTLWTNIYRDALRKIRGAENQETDDVSRSDEDDLSAVAAQ